MDIRHTNGAIVWHDGGPSVSSSSQETLMDRASRTWEFVTTPKFRLFLTYFCSFMCMGLVLAITGPSLLELGEQTHSSMTGVVYIFTARSIGFFLGTLLGGWAVDRWANYGKTILCASNVLLLIFTFFVPITPYLAVLIMLCLVQGTILGVVDNVAQVLLLRLFNGDGGKEGQPYMQALHAAFGIGGFIAPIIISPFLGGKASYVDPMDSQGEGVIDPTAPTNGTDPGIPITTAAGSTTYHWAYWLICILLLPMCLTLGHYSLRDEVKREDIVQGARDMWSWVRRKVQAVVLGARGRGGWGGHHAWATVVEQGQTATAATAPVADGASADAPSRIVRDESELHTIEEPSGSVPLDGMEDEEIVAFDAGDDDGSSSIEMTTVSLDQPTASSVDVEEVAVEHMHDGSASESHIVGAHGMAHDATGRQQFHRVSSSDVDIAPSTSSPSPLHSSPSSTPTSTLSSSSSSSSLSSSPYPSLATATASPAAPPSAFTPHIVDVLPDDGVGSSELIDDERLKWRLVLLLGCFLFLYVGCESGVASFIYSYGIKQVQMEPSHAAYLTALFWFSFALGRLIGVPLSMRFTSTQLIFADLLGCILSLLTIMIAHDSAPVLWVGSMTYGLSVASIYPSAINYAESRFSVTGRVLSVLVVSASLGEALLPLLMGLSFTSPTGPLGMVLIAMAVAVGAAVIFGIIVAFVAPTHDRVIKTSKSHNGHSHRKKSHKTPRRKKRPSHDRHSTTPVADTTLYSPAHTTNDVHSNRLDHAVADPADSPSLDPTINGNGMQQSTIHEQAAQMHPDSMADEMEL